MIVDKLSRCHVDGTVRELGERDDAGALLFERDLARHLFHELLR